MNPFLEGYDTVSHPSATAYEKFHARERIGLLTYRPDKEKTALHIAYKAAFCQCFLLSVRGCDTVSHPPAKRHSDREKRMRERGYDTVSHPLPDKRKQRQKAALHAMCRAAFAILTVFYIQLRMKGAFV